ncbi:MAG TPA: hypothetical protein VIY53_18680 [Acidobacteriaceae bacterium]
MRVLVRDDRGISQSGVKIEAGSPGGFVSSEVTGADGAVTVRCPSGKDCVLAARVAGFLPVTVTLKPKDAGDGTSVEIALTRAVPAQETVTVHAQPSSPVAEAVTTEETLQPEQATTSPLRPSTLADALPLVPGVMRTADGRVQISGLDELHSTLLVNSVDVTDPATGAFGLSVPVDSVQAVKVAQSPWLAQYGNFTAGVVSADTRRGGDKWAYSLNDPFPDFRIRSAHVEGLRDAAPRFNLSGPLVPNHLFLMESSEYLLDKDEVRTLPFPMNETKSSALNSFVQLDQNLATNQTLTASLHFAPHSLQYANLNYFDPMPVTPNADYQEDAGTILHRWGLGGGMLSSTFAGVRMATSVTPQITGEMTLTPVGNSGSYFGQGSRQATRFQWLETWNPATLNWHGKHAFTIGSVVAHAEDQGYFGGQTVLVKDAAGHLLRSIDFSGTGAFSLADFEPAVFTQDHWMISRDFAVDLGLRAETQSLTYTTRFAPRAGISWAPGSALRTVIRGGLGVFYDEVPLDVYAFSSYPQQVITNWDGSGNIVDGPQTWLNLTSTAIESRFPFIDQKQVHGNFAPYSIAWNVEAEHAINREWTMRLAYLQSSLRDQLLLTPETTPGGNAFVLGASGSGELRQAELTSRLGNNQNRQFFFSYVRQLSQGSQSDAESYLGDFPFPVVRSPLNASNSGEIPNRFLIWGTSTLPSKMKISPRLEFRNGFPWRPVDVLQNYVSLPDAPQPRYPCYFTLDTRVSKDLNVGPKHAVRLSVTLNNLTGHFNPLQVHDDLADPAYGTYFGNYPRKLTVDFDLLF